jgi:hypothetical protein
METEKQAFSYSDITCTLPVTLQSLTELTLIQTIGKHVEVRLIGTAPDTMKDADVENVPPDSPITIKILGRDQPFFAGVCTSISMVYRADVKTVEIKGSSWTAQLDIKKKSRSYQKLGIPYNELVDDVLKDYPEKDYRINLPEEKNYTIFAVQYWETDWQFLKRIAAREGTVLVPDYCDEGQRPRFWLGLPNAPAKPLTPTARKTVGKDIEKYLNLASNRLENVDETEFFSYEDYSYEILTLGEKVDYNGRTLIITKIITEIEKGLLKNTYTLALSEKMALERNENQNLQSVALTGKVLASSNIHSKIHLDIDEEQDEGNAIWFPYAAPTNNFLYCMPQNGEDINLYFRDGWEANAIAISGARKNGGGCKKTADYNNRYFTNSERKELFLSPDTVSYTVDESAGDKITIRMTDPDGIFIESKQHIGIGADINLKLNAEKSIELEGGLGTYVVVGDASIILKEEVDISGPAKIKMDGSAKSDFPPLEQEEETVEDAIDNFSEEHPLLMAAVGMIPVVGSLVDAYDAYKCFKSGDIAGGLLNGASAVVGLIPGGKVVTTGVKAAAEGGLAVAMIARAK